jgi:hypothetical protein
VGERVDGRSAREIKKRKRNTRPPRVRAAPRLAFATWDQRVDQALVKHRMTPIAVIMASIPPEGIVDHGQRLYWRGCNCRRRLFDGGGFVRESRPFRRRRAVAATATFPFGETKLEKHLQHHPGYHA